MTSESIFVGLRSIADALRAAGKQFAVVGGLAISVRGEPRFTRDVVDAINLVLVNGDLDLDAVRANLQLILERGFDRGENLLEKLESILSAARTQQAQ